MAAAMIRSADRCTRSRAAREIIFHSEQMPLFDFTKRPDVTCDGKLRFAYIGFPCINHVVCTPAAIAASSSVDETPSPLNPTGVRLQQPSRASVRGTSREPPQQT